MLFTFWLLMKTMLLLCDKICCIKGFYEQYTARLHFFDLDFC